MLPRWRLCAALGIVVFLGGFWWLVGYLVAQAV
jgi:hypothetical protein